MKIGVIGSMRHADKMLWACKELEKAGHTPFISGNAEEFLGLSDEDCKRFQAECQYERDAIREFWQKMQQFNRSFSMEICR